MDIRKLTSEDLPKFNDLLDPDTPCLYDKVSKQKRPLGKHVSVLVVAEPEQLASVGKSDEAPGADSWRRINRPGNTWRFDILADNGQSKDISDVPPVLAEFPYAEGGIDDEDIVYIDFHLHSNWRQLLLGGPGVDQLGRIRHIPGKLEQLKAGQRVILKGANWNDLAFEQTIRQLIAQKRYESNGVVCKLPDNVQFYQMSLRDDELRSLFETMIRSGDKVGIKESDKALARNTPQNPLIINQSNITQWLNPICIDREGYAAPNTTLLEQVQSGAVVTVTSPLNESLWFRLLGALQNIHKATGIKPQLQVTHRLKQPEPLELEENNESTGSITRCLQEKTGDHASVNTVIYQQHTQANHWINAQQETPLVIQINEQTSFSQLFDNIHITSEQNARFGHCQSQFQVALMTGRRVVFRGLESNPKLQQLLETLACGQPLLVNGKLQAYPSARITILWPEPATSPSSVWCSMIAEGESCPEVDFWDINAVNHGIPRAELPEQALNELYNAFKTVPADLCNPLPEMTKGLLNNLILAARRAQQVDQAPQLQPCHWRKAINSVLTHGTHQNPSVRDFMKVACGQLLPDTEHTAWVDPDRLNAVINSARRLDRDFVMENVWKLARAFGPAVFANTGFKQLNLSYKCPYPYSWEETNLKASLCALIVAQVPQAQQSSVAFQLGVDLVETKPYQQLSIKPLNQIKRLEDALASGWQLRPQSAQTRSDAIQTLARDCFAISREGKIPGNNDTECIERLKQLLAQSLEWKGSAWAPFSSLAHDLYYGSINQKDRELRRLSRLHDRLVDSPAIFLQGETGTGKSYFSAKMANASGQAKVISLGPSDNEQTLMKRWQWQHRGDDRYMAQQNRMLMEWANTQPDTDGHYVTLVLDEANLAKTGLLASLNGLWEPEPCIYVNGHPVKVSTQHRVILTGNPDHYAGRQLDPELKEKLPSAYYPPLNRAFLRDRVVEPTLLRHLQRHLPEPQSGDIVRSATDSVMALWQYYPECLPEHEFTPRDLTDICSWVGWYLDRALSDTYTGGSVSIEQVNGLVLQSFRDVLGAEVPDTNQDARASLESWFSARSPVDRTLSDKVHNQTLVDIQQAFIKVAAQTRPEFDTSGSAVSELVQRLGQDLSRCQQAYHHGRKHGGRQATLIEGPAGRGKDATLKLLIESVKQQTRQREESMPEVFYLNACDCSWDELCAVIHKAKIDGGIVVISEMNLIDSQHLEGELNDILAGDAHPGFHLFATTNPPEYSGRKPLSLALKGRFRHLPIRQYNPEELQTIVEKVLPQTPQGRSTAELLTHWHCRLRSYLQQKNLPLQPTSLDLQNVARAVISNGDFTENSLRQHINQHYQLYLMAAKTSLEKLPELSAMTIAKGVVDHALFDWFYCTVTGIDRPWLIRRKNTNSFDEEHHEICIQAHLSEAEARTEIIRMVAQARWQASGLSLKPDSSNDTLTQALYRHWQHCWFKQGFGQTGVDANTVFTLTDEQEQTLNMSANQSYLREANKRISTWDSSDVFQWSAFWQTMSRIELNSVSQYSRSKNEATIYTLDSDTNYEQKELTLSVRTKIFNNNTDPRMYRLSVYDVALDDQGNVVNRLLGRGEYALEAVFPATLPEGEITLAIGQSLGVVQLDVRKNKYYYLPSLNPDETIPALRITPSIDYRLLKDRYTGLHIVSFPDVTETQKITINYVVEERLTTHPGKKTVGDTRPDCTVSESMKSQLAEFFNDFEKSAIPEKQKKQIHAIKLAKTEEDRIRAITRYCRKFKGEKRHESVDGGFFRFLLWNRQGECRHRTPIFVAICRYFAIPARIVRSQTHSYPEYSLDGGIRWQSVNLGGAELPLKIIEPVFQSSIRGSGSSTESKRVKDLLKKGATPEQLQSLAKIYDQSPETLQKTLEAGCSLPKTDLSTSEVVRKLWKEKDLHSFSLGASMLDSMETLTDDLQNLIGDVFIDRNHTYKPMSTAVKQILSSSGEDQILPSSGEDQMIQSLQSLHTKIIGQNKSEVLTVDWLSSMVDILRGSNLAHPSVIRVAHEALESGWLDPLNTYHCNIMGPDKHHDLLLSLQGVDELQTKATRCLKKWYQNVLSMKKNSEAWRRFRDNRGAPFFVTHSHDGVSPFLEEKIASTSLQTSWTDEPEGVPDIERMLVHNPAFPHFNSGKNNHRPVIIVGQPSDKTVFEVRADVLFQQKLESSLELKKLLERIHKRYEMKEKFDNEMNALPIPYALRTADPFGHDMNWCYSMDKSRHKQAQPEYEEYETKCQEIRSRYEPILESLDVSCEYRERVYKLEKECQQAVLPYDGHNDCQLERKLNTAALQAFSHYLYRVTHSKGGRLTYCWVDADFGFSWRYQYGAHDPSSPEELFAMISQIKSNSVVAKSLKDNYLRQAYNASNALVLKSDEMTKIYREFMSSVNLSSIYASLDT